jgi:tetratricopeptide (TPR) repeat protein
MNAAGMQAGIARVLPRERWWQLVLLHEMAHALRVPADRSHTWHRGHCTRPDCVLYARIDHRSALRVLLGRQWPMDLCPLCQQEIRRAQETAGGTLIDPDQPYDHLAAVEALVSANPEHFMAYTARAAVYSDRGECERAIADYTRAIELNPEDALAWNNRSITFARMGKLDRAVEDQNRAVELEPRSAYRRRVRAGMLMQAHQFAAAISDLEQCLAQTPNDPIALTRLACVLATADAEGIRNGARAVALARRACELDQWKQPSMLDVLAAACAEAGRFDEAVAYQQRALGAFPDADPGYQQHLDLYRAGKPLRQ